MWLTNWTEFDARSAGEKNPCIKKSLFRYKLPKNIVIIQVTGTSYSSNSLLPDASKVPATSEAE